MPEKKLVYIAGPISNGGTTYEASACAAAINTMCELERRGYATHCPQLAASVDGAWEIPWESWVESGKKWVEACDAVLRLPGESKGADIEVNHALKEGIAVVATIDELDELFGVKRNPDPPANVLVKESFFGFKVVPLTEAKVCKGGQNPTAPGGTRPPAPGGSGGKP